MWNVVSDNMILNASPTLDDAMVYAKGYNKFVTITDGTTEIVGKFGLIRSLTENALMVYNMTGTKKVVLVIQERK